MGAPFKPWQKKFSDWFGLELVIKPLTKNYNDNTLPFMYKLIAYCLSYNNSYTLLTCLNHEYFVLEYRTSKNQQKIIESLDKLQRGMYF